MKIIPVYERLHSGEHLSRTLRIDFEGLEGSFIAKLAFVTPSGQMFLSGELDTSGDAALYEIPSVLLDTKGLLVCQAVAYFDNAKVIKSDCVKLPVKESVDDMSCPEVSSEAVKSLNDIFDMIEKKADAQHTHEEYALKDEVSNIPENLSAFNNDVGFVKADEMNTALLSKSDAEHTHEEYASKDELPNIPENISAFNNDAGFVKADEMNTALLSKSDAEHTHEEYASKDELPEIPENISAFNNDAGFVKADEMNTALLTKSDTGHTHEEYALKSELTEIPENISAFNNDAGYVDSVALDSLLTGKQDKLTIDSAPVKNSPNPVSSGGVFDALSSAGAGAVSSVNGKTGSVELTAADVGALPDSVSIPESISQLRNDAGYVTGEEMNTALLSKSDTGHTHEEYASKDELPNIPENISAFNNDAGFVKADEMNAALLTKSDTGHTHEEYVSKDELPNIPENISAFNNDAGFVKADEMNTALLTKSDTGHTHGEFLKASDAGKIETFVFEGDYAVSEFLVKNLTQSFADVYAAYSEGKRVCLKLNTAEYSGIEGNFALLPLVAVVPGAMIFEAMISREGGSMMASVVAFSDGGTEMWNCNVYLFDSSGADTFRFFLNGENMSITDLDGRTTEELYDFVASGGKPNIIIVNGNTEYRATVTDKILSDTYYITSCTNFMLRTCVWSLQRDAIRHIYEFNLADVLAQVDNMGQHYIVSSGTYGIWDWKVYSDGEAECSCRFAVTTTIKNNWDNSLFYISPTFPDPQVAFPFEFDGVPNVISSADGSLSVFLINGGKEHTATELGNFHLARPFAVNENTPFTVNICVKGKLKQEVT